ncbi:Pentatricopeptide repeat-containing protein At2g35030, mitochondrial [Linum perenne]
MPQRNMVSWNSMLSAYLHSGEVDNASKLFDEMPQRDLFSFTLMITVYIRNEELEKARKVFNLLGFDDRKDPACWNALIAGYAKKRRFDEAKRLLDEMPVKNLVSWNSMLAGYTKNGEMELGLQFFEEMEVRDAVSYNPAHHSNFLL